MAVKEPTLVLSNRVNLDDLFGNVCINTITEPVTPFRMVIYELIRVLHEVHQEPPLFSSQECNMLHSLLFGLLDHGEMPFVEMKRVVRYIDKTIREGIYAGFIYSINCTARGRDMTLQLDGLMSAAVKRTATQTPSLFSNRSHVATWLKKLYVSWSEMSTQEMFDLFSETRAYIKDSEGLSPDISMSDVPQFPREVVPFEIESSSRARNWIETQLHLMQVCPSAAFPGTELLDWCQIIKRIHRDIPQVNMLEMLDCLRNKDSNGAHTALRKFFDYSMFRPNLGETDSAAASSLKRLGSTDQRPLRYGPLLHARLYRLFGDRDTARFLLSESVQQAQSVGDRTCLRLAMVELAAIEAMPVNRLGRARANVVRSSSRSGDELTSSGVLKILEKEGGGPDMAPMTAEEGGARAAGGAEKKSLHQHLREASSLLYSIAAFHRGHFESSELAGACQARQSSGGDDRGARARLMGDAGTAVLTSIRIQQGAWKTARSAALALVKSNYGDGLAPHHETESQAVAGVNAVYSYVAEGKWETALEMVKELRERFSEHINWQAAEHVQLCAHLVAFDNSFRLGLWSECDGHLCSLEAFSPEESVIRGGLLLAQRGRLGDAQQRLTEEQVTDDAESTFTYQMRLRLQLGMILACKSLWNASLNLLQVVSDRSTERGIELLANMAKRRIATVHLMSGNVEIAIEEFANCAPELQRFGTECELALLYIGWARASMNMNRDPVRSLAMARLMCQRAGFPLLEKTVLQYSVEYYHKLDDVSKRDDACEQFCVLDDKYPTDVDWQLF